MPHPRLRDVAALAGVAVSTVSVVLNEVDGARVSDDTRRRVLEAAEVLGYTPNAHARSLRAAGPRSLVLIDDLISGGPYGGDLIQGAHDAAWRAGATLVVLSTGGHPDREAAALKYAVSQRVDGVLLARLSFDARSVPIADGLVLVNCEPETDSAVTHFVPDEVTAGRTAAGELLDLGHRRVAAMTITGSLAAERRMIGLRAGLTEGGVELADEMVDVSSKFDASAHGGYLASRRLLDRLCGPDRPTALFCFNDRMAMGAYRAVADLGLAVAEDVSIISVDNAEPVAESLHPELTTIALPYFELGEKAVEAALDPGSVSGRVEVHCPLIRRFSVSRPPSGVSREAQR